MMGDILELTITAPGPWISTNSQRTRHHYQQAAQVKLWRNAARLAAVGTPAVEHPVTITATVHKATRLAWDLDGITPTIKACIDGLRDAGVLADDDCRHVVALHIVAGCVCKPARLDLSIERPAP